LGHTCFAGICPNYLKKVRRSGWIMNSEKFKKLEGTHDLNLSKWGPYTKEYMGISHIPDEKDGLRFDLSVFPGFYRRKVDVPNVMWESGYHPWEASPDLDYFSHRHELEWKDKVYCDISFSAIDESSRLIRCECVNSTEQEQSLVLHYMASINFPPVRPYNPKILEPAVVGLPEGAKWIDALNYRDLQFAVKRPTDNLGTDGFWRGEVRDSGFTDGRGLGQGFGKDAGDRVTYEFNIEYPISDGVLILRYKLKENSRVLFKTEGIINETIELLPEESFAVKNVKVGTLASGEHTLILESLGDSSMELDGFAIVSSDKISEINFTTKEWNYYPEITMGSASNSLLLKYKDIDNYYGIVWDYEDSEVREFYCDELDRYLRFNTHHHTTKKFMLNDQGHYTNVFMRPIEIEKNSKRVLYGMVCYGSKDKVEAYIKSYREKKTCEEEIFKAGKSKAVKFNANKEGEKYLFSQERMAATTLTNVVYPVYTRKSYIKHNTPGRWWDCLYTWDSGFIGLGLTELDINRAIDCLNAYVTEPGDEQAAFIHHGSPVPVQFYLFLELWNKTQSKELLKYFYPRLQQYHRFLSGRLGSSTTRVLKSNLIKTWDYFYNSGGWDDYPPQVHVHRNKIQKYVAPVSNTAHSIRTAKILKMAAYELGKLDDIKEYEEDIEILSEAIQKYSWDEESAYFGYVCHDEQGYPQDILRHESSKNYNMGLDGAYPLVAGICTKEQEKKLLGHLSSRTELFSSIGLSAVDQSAPYYKIDGYWNGTVWMPHQWFFWKTLLDVGQGDLAYDVAKTGLEVWKNEVDSSYNCFEHFIIQTGRGAGWHHFGGLSTPVMCWFNAYFQPGRLTCGLDIWVMSKNFSENNNRMDAGLRYFGDSGRKVHIVVSMNPNKKYNAAWNGEKVDFKEIMPGVLQIELTFNAKEGNLNIRAL
jgi:hypothetical protein